MRYDYQKRLKNRIINYIVQNYSHSIIKILEDPDCPGYNELTSYMFNDMHDYVVTPLHKTDEFFENCLCGNVELMAHAYELTGPDNFTWDMFSLETADMTIREYLFPRLFEEVLDETAFNKAFLFDLK